jgi:hypothetical protein
MCWNLGNGCPTSAGSGCLQDIDAGIWYRVTKYYTHYDCLGGTGIQKECDLDDDNWNNVCADTVEYASQLDCANEMNSIGTGNRFTRAICNGSDSCL